MTAYLRSQRVTVSQHEPPAHTPASTTTKPRAPMLKKNQPVKLKEGSTMWTVYQSISNGSHSQSQILVNTALRLGKVRSALHNLRFVGMIDLVEVDGRARYYLPDQERPRNAEIGKAENVTPAQTLAINSIWATNATQVERLSKGGRPTVDRPEVIKWRPKSPAARNKYLEMGGSKWLDRVMEGLTK